MAFNKIFDLRIWTRQDEMMINTFYHYKDFDNTILYWKPLKMLSRSVFSRQETRHFGIFILIIIFLLELNGTLGCAVVECICHRGEIDCLNLDYRSVPVFAADGRFYDTLDLGMNRLRRIRGNAFKNLTVRKIKIRQNKRPMEIHKKAFRGLEDRLEVLHITRSGMETLPPTVFK